MPFRDRILRAAGLEFSAAPVVTTGESHGQSQVSATDGARTQGSDLLPVSNGRLPLRSRMQALQSAELTQNRSNLRSQYAGGAKKIVSAAVGEGCLTVAS